MRKFRNVIKKVAAFGLCGIMLVGLTACGAKASNDIAQERKNAVNAIKNDISGIAVSIASKVVEKEISEKDHEALIQDFIDQMGEAV